MQVKASHYLPVDKEAIPIGHIEKVIPKVDLNEPVELGQHLSKCELNHCFVVNKAVSTTLRSIKTGIRLTIESDQLAMQVYSGNYLPEKHRAIALEAQGLVDAINQSGFPVDIVSPDNPYLKTVKYRFDII